MFKTAESSLQKKALHAVIVLPEEKLPILIQFADFLKNESYNADIPDFSEKNTAEKRSSISGCLKGKSKSLKISMKHRIVLEIMYNHVFTGYVRIFILS